MATVAAEPTLNPHFDQDRFVWDDAYSGEYHPVQYSEQFDHQWQLFLEKKRGFHRHTGVETSDPWIDDRIFELTGVADYLGRRKYKFLFPLVRMWRRWTGISQRDVGGRLYLEPKFDLDFVRGKRCLDVGCGAGRWTRTLKVLGARVKSVDLSEHGLASTRRFNDDVEPLNLFDIKDKRPDLHRQFDFTLCWGVVMCTHDPKTAFENVALTVKPGGRLYTMIYAPTYHNTPQVTELRKHYHRRLHTAEERLCYVYQQSGAAENAINYLDMLNTFYNWTVPEAVIHNWYRRNGFADITTLNAHEPNLCAYHVLGTRKMTGGKP
jgi:2-polyprenyl-3-methyl-5-hydroxy-6-metoxy-1,4-benzoquinol methylase